MFACCLLAGSAGVAEPIGEYLTLALGFNLALSADHASDWGGFVARFKDLWRGAVLFAVQVGLFVLLISIPIDVALDFGDMLARLKTVARPEDLITLFSGPTTLVGIYEKNAYDLMAWAMLLPVGLGFLYPLRAFGLDFRLALMQCRQAAALNQRPLIFILACSLASVFLCMSFGFYYFLPLVQGFWMAVNYVMFRDIFLGVSKNRPVRVAVSAMAMQPALVRVSSSRRIG